MNVLELLVDLQQGSAFGLREDEEDVGAGEQTHAGEEQEAEGLELHLQTRGDRCERPGTHTAA